MSFTIPTLDREIPLSTIALSTAAESGDLSRDLGLIPARSHQPPAGLLLGWRRFLDASSQPRASNQHHSRCSALRTSSHHPAPRRPAA
jgi:hypothetical protein